MALSLQQAMASRQYTAKVEMLRNLGEVTEVFHVCIVSDAISLGDWLLAMFGRHSYAAWITGVCMTFKAESMLVHIPRAFSIFIRLPITGCAAQQTLAPFQFLQHK